MNPARRLPACCTCSLVREDKSHDFNAARTRPDEAGVAPVRTDANVRHESVQNHSLCSLMIPAAFVSPWAARMDPPLPDLARWSTPPVRVAVKLIALADSMQKP